MSSSRFTSRLCLAFLALWLPLGHCYIAFTPSSTHGVFAALAVPLELPHRNVFVSYNFEANYNSPYNWSLPTIFQNGPIESEEIEESRKHAENAAKKEKSEQDGQEEQSGEEEELQQEQDTTSIPSPSSTSPRPAPPRERRALLSRTNIYHILMDKFQRNGFAGEACLLRLICETNSAQLAELNGVLGSLMHVLFSPSTSEPEQLPLRFYQAEHDGWHDHCHYYEQHCERSVLDLISEPFEEILRRIEHNEM